MDRIPLCLTFTVDNLRRQLMFFPALRLQCLGFIFFGTTKCIKNPNVSRHPVVAAQIAPGGTKKMPAFGDIIDPAKIETRMPCRTCFVGR